MTIKKEPDDNIYYHQAPGYSAKIEFFFDLVSYQDKIIRSDIPRIWKTIVLIENK